MQRIARGASRSARVLPDVAPPAACARGSFGCVKFLEASKRLLPIALAAAAALAATGCDQSISVHGRLLKPDGSPAKGAHVTLYGPHIDPEAEAPTVDADDDGNFEISGAVEDGGAGSLARMTLYVAASASSPPAAEVTFPEEAGDRDLKDLQPGKKAQRTYGCVDGVCVLDLGPL
jgi:hypothetical protein